MNKLASRLHDLQSAYARRGERIEAMEKELTRVYKWARFSNENAYVSCCACSNIIDNIPAELRGLAGEG